MKKGQIRKLNKELSTELIQIQELFINSAENYTAEHIASYKKLPSSLNGNYICADLFKETFPLYTESIDTRKKYSEVVHNSAACLANDMFHQTVTNPNINKCIFLTGIPGAGKSFLVQSMALKGAISDDTMIYEGTITTPTIIEKIKTASNNNKELYIVVVNPTLDLAQRNAINRHFEIGRGASCETMAKIMSGIPNALVEIQEQFPDITLGIFNKSSNYDIDYHVGFEYIQELNHGTYEDILSKLKTLRLQILTEMNEDLKKKLAMNSQESREEKKHGR